MFLIFREIFICLYRTHVISSKKNYYYSYFHLILGKNSTAEKTKIPLAYSDYLHYFYIGLNLLFF